MHFVPPVAPKVASLFSGIGGIELGLGKAGFQTELLCEIDPAATQVLERRFVGVPVVGDVRKLKSLPKVDVLSAGFPCQDLSQAGRKVGIVGGQSGLVYEIFRLLKRAGSSRPKWIVFENVAYMLRLQGGKAMLSLIKELESLGYKWAYRVVDIRSFGLPQRRQRVILLASRAENPAHVLLSQDFGIPEQDPKPSETKERACYGFYWTEGSRGVGWAYEATPPIKGGSSVGIPSPPAVWKPKNDFVGTIDIVDAERLQGFPSRWTECISGGSARQCLGHRWRMIGNAVAVPMAEWLGRRLLSANGSGSLSSCCYSEWLGGKLPLAAWGGDGKFFAAMVSMWPIKKRRPLLSSFLKRELKPLSERATIGFLGRAKTCSNVVYSDRFLDSLRIHASNMKQQSNS